MPGSGYLLIGQWARGITAGLTILLTFVAGIFIGGVRVVDVPGYAEGGRKVMLVPEDSAAPRWALR